MFVLKCLAAWFVVSIVFGLLIARAFGYVSNGIDEYAEDIEKDEHWLHD